MGILVRMSDRGRESYHDPVKAWTDPEKWAQRLTPEGCPFCPMEPWSAHVELPASWVLIPDEAVVLEQAEVLSANWGVEPPSDEAVALGDAPAYATADERLTELPAVAERADLREPPGL